MSGLPPSTGPAQPTHHFRVPVWGVVLLMIGFTVLMCGLLAAAIKVRTKQADLELETNRLLHETRRVGLAVMMYGEDYRNTIPNGTNPATLASQLKPYVSGMVNLESKIGAYRLNSHLNGHAIPDLANAAEVWVCEQGPDQQHYTYVSFADGHAKRYVAGEEKPVMAIEPRSK